MKNRIFSGLGPLPSTLLICFQCNVIIYFWWIVKLFMVTERLVKREAYENVGGNETDVECPSESSNSSLRLMSILLKVMGGGSHRFLGHPFVNS
jgi:hypothetical protein